MRLRLVSTLTTTYIRPASLPRSYWGIVEIPMFPSADVWGIYGITWSCLPSSIQISGWRTDVVRRPDLQHYNKVQRRNLSNSHGSWKCTSSGRCTITDSKQWRSAEPTVVVCAFSRKLDLRAVRGVTRVRYSEYEYPSTTNSALCGNNDRIAIRLLWGANIPWVCCISDIIKHKIERTWL